MLHVKINMCKLTGKKLKKFILNHYFYIELRLILNKYYLQGTHLPTIIIHTLNQTFFSH